MMEGYVSASLAGCHNSKWSTASLFNVACLQAYTRVSRNYAEEVVKVFSSKYQTNIKEGADGTTGCSLSFVSRQQAESVESRDAVYRAPG